MHLKSLTLKGFKSFASATTLRFEPGICAVVGPNGSGKSNVVDALAWVMGEGSAKTLRGGKMQDVIFAGTGGRKALGRAEVTLTIDNHDGALDIDYAEVSITRRMFRDGASEYEINGARARLMDVQELLSDSGIGREMHIIVGQGKLAEILESRPEERRAYIEEAAGVLKYRRRKEKAQRKLAGMQGNLDRLRDLTDELATQLGPLARQAEAAGKAAQLQAQVRELKLVLAAHRVAGLRATWQEAAETLERAGASDGAASREAAEAEAEVAAAERTLAAITPAAHAAQDLWFRLSTLEERVRAIRRIAAERAAGAGEDTPFDGPDPDELEARARHADTELADLEEAQELARDRLMTLREESEAAAEALNEAEREHRAALRAIADRREGIVRILATEEAQSGVLEAARRESVREEEARGRAAETVRRAREELAEANARRREAENDLAPLAEAHENARREQDAAERRLAELIDQQRDRERATYALRSRIEVLADQAPRSPAAIKGFAPLSDHVRAPGFAAALAAALGGVAGALVGKVDAQALGIAREASRVVLLDAASGMSAGWRLEARLPEGSRWLLDEIEMDEAVAGPMTRILADVVLCPNRDSAVALIREDPRLRAVTRDGELLGPGWVEVGRGAPTRVEIGEEIAEARRALAAAEASLAEISGTVAGAAQAADEARVRGATAVAALKEAEAVARSARAAVEQAERSVDTAEKELTRAESSIQEAGARVARAEQALAETRARLAGVEAPEEEPSTGARDEAAAALEQLRAMEVEARVEARAAGERVAAARGAGDRLRRAAAQARADRRRHEERLARRRARVAVARVVGRCTESVGRAIGEELAEAETRREELALARADAEETLGRVRADRAEAVRRAERAHARLHAAELDESRAKVRLDEAEAKAEEQLGVSADELVDRHAPGPDFDREEEASRLRGAQRRLTALGKVNPLALEEYRALEERHGFLSRQLADVEKARADLEGVIRDVDGTIQRLFEEAWRDVEREFPKVFAILFPGGEGRLFLTDPSDMLATGIELEARPPGKKVRRLTLLSGGEKSLTALALLVAIFRARPSPFYVLDEVEAALDDVNLRRLINLLVELRRDSQLIVITHQKPTMDVANVLYGVTMRGDGITRVISQRLHSPDEEMR